MTMQRYFTYILTFLFSRNLFEILKVLPLLAFDILSVYMYILYIHTHTLFTVVREDGLTFSKSYQMASGM